MMRLTLVLVAGVLMAAAPPAQNAMTFFITSVGPGDGANLGGLEGADRHCHQLAAAAGAGDRTWRAYLSTINADGTPAVHARDRIGRGPWHNARGIQVAAHVADLHSDQANLTKYTSLTERGDTVFGRGDSPNRHDVITGSNLDGTAFTGEGYTNCGNWTSNAAEGGTRTGHHDRTGGGQNPTSWNSAHATRGCSQANLQATGGNGLYYCFAVTP
ncbi:MAG: hypothetical protein WD934_07790 [Gemmatimonadales bacterium]